MNNIKKVAIKPPLYTETKGGFKAVIEFIAPADRSDMFFGAVWIGEYERKEASWGVNGICRDSRESWNLMGNFSDMADLKSKYHIR